MGISFYWATTDLPISSPIAAAVNIKLSIIASTGIDLVMSARERFGVSTVWIWRFGFWPERGR